jgi:hypothetical protein
MYPAYERAIDRQQDMLDAAVAQRHGRMAARLGRAARRVDRAEMRLVRTRCDSQSVALTAELAGLELVHR